MPLRKLERPCRIHLIGQYAQQRFRVLANWIRDRVDVQVTESANLEEALTGRTDELQNCDLVVVLQQTPDQYSAADVNRLIGATLFRRLLCCYGPWCESDARTRSVWPDATRVSMYVARSVIAAEIAGCRVDGDVLPATASREEVFGRRTCPTSHADAATKRRLAAAVISPDHVLRRTYTAALQQMGIAATSASPGSLTSNRLTDFVVYDFDPWNASTENEVREVCLRFPSTAVFGLASLPSEMDLFKRPDSVTAIVSKLDVVNGLQWQIRDWIQATQHTDRYGAIAG